MITYEIAEQWRAEFNLTKMSKTDFAKSKNIEKSVMSRLLRGETYRGKGMDRNAVKGMDGPDRDRQLVENGFCQDHRLWSIALNGY